MSVKKRRQQAINRRQWVIDLRKKWDAKRGESGEAMFVLIGVVALIFVGFLVFSVVSALHVEHRTCTVEDKDRTTTKDGSSDARLYTEDCGVLHVGDSLFSWNWHSSDTYAAIKPGETYKVTTRGFRVPFLSMFPNVVEAEQVDR